MSVAAAKDDVTMPPSPSSASSPSTPQQPDSNSANSVDRKKKSSRKLHTFTRLHEEGFAYLADNSYIRTGYRLHYTFGDCFLSMFELHNETLNVWTHMVGALIFITLFVYVTLQRTAAYDVVDGSNGALSLAPVPKFCDVDYLSPHATLMMQNGFHTPKMMASIYLRATCPQYQQSTVEVPEASRRHLEIAGLIFENSIRRMPSLEALQMVFQEKMGEMSNGMHAQMELMKHELEKMRERLGNVKYQSGAWGSSVQQMSTLKDQLHYRVEVFSGFLQNLATSDAKADRSLQFVLEEMQGLTESVKNGIALMSTAAVDAVENHQLSVGHWPLFVFMTSAVICLTCSATFHLLYVYSRRMYLLLSRLDYAGITVMIAGSFYPVLYYSFYCHPNTMQMYLVGISTLAAVTFLVTLAPWFSSSKYLYLRTLIFISLGLSGFVPLVHMIVYFGLYDPHVTVMMGPLLVMGALYVIGATIYALRIPERFFPGRFDLWFSSHQLWHMFVVAAALVHFVNALQQLEWRKRTECNV